MEMNPMKEGRTQLQAIHAMLSIGHASVRMERHTLILWGLTAAGLILLVPQLFPKDVFVDPTRRMWLQNGFISCVLLGVGVWDMVWTARIRRCRDETISFVQRQVTKLWWLLVALVVVINIGMNLYGGGFFFYGITLVLTGIGIYVYGLFSRQMLTWSGALQILLGLIMIALSPEIAVQKWVAACAFGVGFPAFALMVDRTEERSMARELLLSFSWLALVLVPAFAMASISQDRRFDNWPVVSWSGYLQQIDEEGTESMVVKLPAGTHVPVSMNIGGDLLQPLEPPPPLIMRTTRMVDLAVENEEVMGLRQGEGNWHSRYDYRIKNWDLKGRLSPTEGPVIDLSFQVLLER